MLSREVKERLREYETPFYLYDMELLRRTVECALREADRYGYRLHYAMKANNDRRIMEFIASCGMGADCVSGNEVRRAIETGFAPKDIVYAGVGKKDSEIIYALRQGIFAFNCESKNELVVIDALARELGVVADVALRINPDIDPHTHSYITTGLSENKFGISPREITDVVGMLGDLRNIDIMGLHFHIGSQITDLGVFAELCRKVNASYRWFTEEGFRITDVNVGGGLGVDYDVPEMHPVPDFAAYFAVFAQGLDLPASVGVHFELGRSLVAQCGELISTVLFTKVSGLGDDIALIDASMTELLRPALYHSRHAIENLTGTGPERAYTIGGTVCESSDIFARDLSLPELRRGDLLSIKTAGAYGAAMASRYNLHDLPRRVVTRPPLPCEGAFPVGKRPFACRGGERKRKSRPVKRSRMRCYCVENSIFGLKYIVFGCEAGWSKSLRRHGRPFAAWHCLHRNLRTMNLTTTLLKTISGR